jgi:hypothetical protein
MVLTVDPTSPAEFDFLIGSWSVTHRRLKHRLTGSTEWDTFSGSCVVWKILGGFGNVDDNVLELPTGTYRATSLRSYNATTTTWSIWWLDARNPDRLDVPVVGRFEDGVGTFFANDRLAGKPIVVRFRWTLLAPDSPHWEQAFSSDDGRTWETNWTMDFKRKPY